MLKAVTRQASLVDAKIAAINSSAPPSKPKISTAYFFDHYATKEDVDVVVTEEDFMNAERELVPSVSHMELEHYQRVRAQFEKVGEEKVDRKGKGRAVGEETNGNGNANPRTKSNEKKKGKEKIIDKKGKGKSLESWNEDGEDDGDSASGGGGANGHDIKGKGKGRAVDMGFQESQDDDEGLY
jgi:peroxin-6